MGDLGYILIKRLNKKREEVAKSIMDGSCFWKNLEDEKEKRRKSRRSGCISAL